MKSAKRILLFTTDLISGGVKQSTLRLARILIECGHAVTVLSYEAIPSEVIKNEVGIEFFSLNRLLVKEFSENKERGYELKRIAGLFASGVDLFFNWRNRNYDFVFSFSYFPNLLSILFLRFSSGPILIVSERQNPEVDLDLRRLDHRAISFMAKRLYGLSDYVHANSVDMISVIERYYGVSEDRVLFFPNFFDVEMIAKRASDYFPNVPGKYVISCGRLSKQKGHWNSIMAFKYLVDSGYQGSLVLLGSGPLEGELKRLVVGAELSPGRVIFIKDVENPYPYFKHADLMIFPSLWESFGNVILESAALDVPIISSKCEGPSSILSGYMPFFSNVVSYDELNNKSLESRNDKIFREMSIEILGALKRRDELVERAKDLARSYSKDVVMKKIAEVFDA